MTRPLALLLLAALVPLSSCAYLRGTGGPREFEDASAMLDSEPIPAGELRYQGPLRTPLAMEWSRELPDAGVWAISRFEQGQALVRRDRIWIGGSRAPGVEILDRRSGALVSTVETVNPVQCQPLSVGDRVLIADTGGYVYLVDDDGNVLWRYNAGGPIYATPTVVEERVYVVTLTDDVVALELRTGTWLWSFRSEERRAETELTILGSSRALVHDGKLYVGLGDGRLICLDADIGMLLWELSIAEGRFLDVDATPRMTDDGMLITGSYSGPVVAVDPDGPSLVWRAEHGVVGDLLLMYGRVFLSDDTGTLRSLDAADGTEQWSYKPRRSKKLLSAPTGYGRILLVAHNEGTLFAVDAFSGEQLWHSEQPRQSLLGAAVPPVIAGRQVIYVTADGMIRSMVAPPSLSETHDEEPAQRDSRHLNW